MQMCVVQMQYQFLIKKPKIIFKEILNKDSFGCTSKSFEHIGTKKFVDNFLTMKISDYILSYFDIKFIKENSEICEFVKNIFKRKKNCTFI